MVYWLKLRAILTKENDLNVFIKELFMKKIITAVAMASLLSGCQLIEQLQSKGGKRRVKNLTALLIIKFNVQSSM